MTQNMRRGFTMIELVFVIVIIGILAAVAIPKMSSVKDDAQMATAAQTFCSDAVKSKLGVVSETGGTINGFNINDVVALRTGWTANASGVVAGTWTGGNMTPTLSNSTNHVYVYYVDANETLDMPVGCFVSNADGSTKTISGSDANASFQKGQSVIYK